MAENLLPLGVTAVMLPELTFDEQIALCSELGVTHYSIRPRVIPEGQRDKPWGNWGNHKFDLTPDRLLKEGQAIAKQLRDAGLTPFGTVPGLAAEADEDELKKHFEGAANAGAGRVRVQPPGYTKGELFDYPAHVERTVAAYKRAVDIAKPFGQKLVIETHRGTHVCAPGLAREVCKHFDPSEVGVIFDIANYSGEGEVNPFLAVSVIGDWIDHVHIGGGRRAFGEYDEAGFRKVAHMMTKMTEGDLYIPDWLAALKLLGREVPLVIEDYTPHIPGALRLRDSATALHRALESL